MDFPLTCNCNNSRPGDEESFYTDCSPDFAVEQQQHDCPSGSMVPMDLDHY